MFGAEGWASARCQMLLLLSTPLLVDSAAHHSSASVPILSGCCHCSSCHRVMRSHRDVAAASCARCNTVGRVSIAVPKTVQVEAQCRPAVQCCIECALFQLSFRMIEHRSRARGKSLEFKRPLRQAQQLELSKSQRRRLSSRQA